MVACLQYLYPNAGTHKISVLIMELLQTCLIMHYVMSTLYNSKHLHIIEIHVVALVGN